MSSRFSQDQGLRAAREGRRIDKSQVDQTVTAAYVVELHADIYYDIPEGCQVVITHYFVGCETVEEFAAAYPVACAEVAGGGAATQLHHDIHDHVGSKKEGNDHVEEDLYPPAVVKYSDGHRSISMALKATDTSTVVKYGWVGWYEDEGTLS